MAPRKRRQGRSVPLLLAVAIQFAIIAVTAFIVVFIPSNREEPVFTTQKTIYLPQRELDHRMAFAEFQQAAQSPMSVERISVEAMLPDSMADLPEMPSMDFNPVQTNVMASASAMFGQSGLEGMLQGLSTEASSVSFLGVEDTATRMIIVFDISVTVTNSVEAAGLSMEQIRDETIELVDQLNANTLFGLIQHSRNFDTFKDYLIPATVENKEAAIQWLRTRFRTDGSGRGWRRHEGRNGIEAVLEVAFNMEPDVIFLMSDGDYWRSEPNNERVPYRDITSLIQRRQDQLPERARIHTIGFGVRDHVARDFRNLSRRNSGNHREY